MTLIGVLGVGHLAEYLIRGSQGAPYRFLLSPRSARRAARLAQTHACEVATGNQAVLDQADHILVCLPAASGLAELAALRFEARHTVLSCLAGASPAAVQRAAGPARAAAAMMPGYANAFGVGPSILCPADADWQRFLSHLGPVHGFADEAAFLTATSYGALSGASVYLLRHFARWFQAQGLDAVTARALVAETFRGNAEVLLRSDEALDSITDGVTTPGGITEALVQSLTDRGALTAWDAGLDQVLARLRGG